MANLEELLKKVCETHAPTGKEGAMAEFMAQHFKKNGFEVRRDVLGNVIAKKGKGRKVMFTAHMDEVSLAVKSVTKEGFLRFLKVGGIYDGTLGGCKVIVHASEDVKGVIGIKAPHLMKDEELKKLPECDEMFIDCGFKDAKEASYYGIRPGTHVTFDAGFEKGRNGFVFSKSLDDRVGCALLCLIAEEFDGKSCELNLVATVREETGLMGAGTSAFAIEPELAIAVDVSMASGTPDVSEENVPVKFRGGAVLGVLEGSGRGLIMEDKLVNWIEGIAKKRKIKLQFEAIERGATDASRMQYVRSGLLTASLLAPARYLHSPCEMVCLEDVMEVKRLALEITKEFKDYK